MIPSLAEAFARAFAVYQRGWMIDSQLPGLLVLVGGSISKGMDD